VHDRKFLFGVIVRRWIGERVHRDRAAGRSARLSPRCTCPTTSSTIPSRDSAARPAAAVTTTCGSVRSCRQRLQASRRSRARSRDDRRALRRSARVGSVRLDDGRLRKAGMPLDRPGVRRRATRESIAILKDLRRRPVSFEGEYYRVTELDGQPKPVQRRTRRSSLAAAVRRCSARGARKRRSSDHANCVGRRHSRGRRRLAHERAHRREGAMAAWTPRVPVRRHRDQTLVGSSIFTGRPARDRRRDGRDFGVPPDDALARTRDLVGNESQIVDCSRRAVKRWAHELTPSCPTNRWRSSRRCRPPFRHLST